MNVWVVIPAYNEESSIPKVLDDLKREGYNQIIVVDDGSSDDTSQVSKSKGVKVVQHMENKGLGAALRTGLEEALKLDADVAVTFDADGQHDPCEISKIINAIDGSDIVIGVRYRDEMPLNKRIGNFILDVVTHLLGGPFTDSQSGFRAFNRKALNEISIQSDGYAVSSEIMMRTGEKKLRLNEVPINCRFTDYSKAQGTTIASGVKIFIDLLKLKAVNTV